VYINIDGILIGQFDVDILYQGNIFALAEGVIWVSTLAFFMS
jgi:hypothetical protein